MVVPPKHFGRQMRVTERSFEWVYELVVTTVWVDGELPQRVPHRFRVWFRYGFNGFCESPLQGFEIPIVVVDATLGESATNPPDGSVEDLASSEPMETEGSANVFS